MGSQWITLSPSWPQGKVLYVQKASTPWSCDPAEKSQQPSSASPPSPTQLSPRTFAIVVSPGLRVSLKRGSVGSGVCKASVEKETFTSTAWTCDLGSSGPTGQRYLVSHAP